MESLTTADLYFAWEGPTKCGSSEVRCLEVIQPYTSRDQITVPVAGKVHVTGVQHLQLQVNTGKQVDVYKYMNTFTENLGHMSLRVTIYEEGVGIFEQEVAIRKTRFVGGGKYFLLVTSNESLAVTATLRHATVIGKDVFITVDSPVGVKDYALADLQFFYECSQITDRMHEVALSQAERNGDTLERTRIRCLQESNTRMLQNFREEIARRGINVES